MESHEVIREAFKRCGPKEISAELGVSLSLVYKWAQPNNEMGSGSRNPLDRVAKMMEMTKEPLLIKWLCERSGGYFLRNPGSRCQEGHEVLPSTNEIVKQFADLLGTITQAALDNEISDKESHAIREVWDDLKSFTEGFVRCCEEGDFRPMEETIKEQENP